MKKTILILVNDLSFLISHRYDIVIAARKKGYQIKIAYGELGNSTTKIFLNKDIECFKVFLQRNSINPLIELFSLFSIWRIFYRLNPDLVHLITIKAYLYGGIAARFTKVPSVLSSIAGLGIFFDQKKNFNFFLQKLLYQVFHFAFNHPNQRVIVQNLDDKKILINWGVIDKKKILLFPGSGEDLSKYTKFTEPKNVTTICFASRLLRNKGVFDYISAAKIIKKKGIKVKFLLAGSLDLGNPTSLTKKELEDIVKEKVVEVLGNQKDIPKLYAKTNIVCLPSFYGEGLPKTLIEAASAGRAIVTTDHPGCRDAIISNKTGLLVPVKNPQKLADALEWLIEHPQERIEMGKAGRKFAKKKFAIEKIIQGHLDTYENLLSDNP
jgi:glycosyltransferase involved in cell wall biosynthesis